MSDFYDITQRATRRLARDRELRREVAAELESHLQASAAEFRAADYDDEAAAAEAAKAFGDPDEVADALWNANRFRLRLRAWAWWAARLTLLPTCVAAVVWFVISGVAYPMQMKNISGGWSSEPTWMEMRVRSRMTDEQRLIYFGDEAADNPVAARKALRDAYPDEPLYQLNYLTTLLSFYEPYEEYDMRATWQQAIDAALVVNEADRGEALDPDNGIYDLIRATTLTEPWFSIEEDKTLSFERLDGRGEVGSEARVKATINVFQGDIDESKLTQALTALQLAAEKPYLTTHSMDMLRHRLEQLPPPRSMQEYLMRIGGEIGTLMPTLGHRRKLARLVSAEAIRRARAGDRDRALELLDTLDRLNAKLAASDDVLIGFQVSFSIEVLERDTRVLVYRALGDEAGEAEALAASDALVRKHRREWSVSDWRESNPKIERGGYLMATLLPAIPGYDVDVAPFRKAEYALFDRAALTVSLMGLVAVSALLSLSALWNAWRKRKTDEMGGVLLWVGWRRLAWVLGGAVGVPVVGFVMWSALPWSGRAYGLNHSTFALLAYAPLVLLVVGLLWMLGIEAFRQRAKEIGLAVPGRPRWWVRGLVLGGLTLGLCVWLTGVMHVGGLIYQDDQSIDSWFAVVILGTLVWAIAAWLAVAISLARLNGVQRPSNAAAHGLAYGIAVGLLFGIVVGGIVMSTTDGMDQTAFLGIVGVVAVGLTLVVGWFRVAGRPGSTTPFARSVFRSMGPVLAAAGLLLVLTAGPMLAWRERALVRGVVERTPVWADQEIEKSNANGLRAYLAGDAVAAPRMGASPGVSAGVNPGGNPGVNPGVSPGVGE